MIFDREEIQLWDSPDPVFGESAPYKLNQKTPI